MVEKPDSREAQGPELTDTEHVARWMDYSRRRDLERRETVNLANRIFGIPPGHWSKRGKS